MACHFCGHRCCMSESKIYTMKSISSLNLRNHFRLTWIIRCLKSSIDQLVADKNENTFFFGIRDLKHVFNFVRVFFYEDGVRKFKNLLKMKINMTKSDNLTITFKKYEINSSFFIFFVQKRQIHLTNRATNFC